MTISGMKKDSTERISHLPSQLKRYRQLHQCSQEDLASILEVKRQTYSNYELGKREPGIRELLLLADFYNIQVDDLIR